MQCERGGQVAIKTWPDGSPSASSARVHNIWAWLEQGSSSLRETDELDSWPGSDGSTCCQRWRAAGYW